MTYEEAFQLVEELTELAKKHSPEHYSAWLLGYMQSRLAQVMVECPMARLSTVRHIEYLKSL